jgi:Na+/alanine symporter
LGKKIQWVGLAAMLVIFFTFMLTVLTSFPLIVQTTGHITALNNQWGSDGTTYSNFTLSVPEWGSAYITVACNYYHVNSTVQMYYYHQDVLFMFRFSYGLTVSSLPEGCAWRAYH